MNAVRLPALVVVIALLVGAFVFGAEEEKERSIDIVPMAYSELSLGISNKEWPI